MARFGILGPLLVLDASGDPVDIRPGNATTVLCVLLSRSGESVSVAEIVDAQWPDDPPASAIGNTRSTVRWLRQALGDPSPIATTASGYVIRPAPGELDAQEFTGLVRQARAARRDDELEAALRLYEQALGLWRGNPYAGQESCQLLVPDLQRLASLRIQALQEKADVCLALGNHAEVILDLVGLVEADPGQERLAGLLMRALYTAGRQQDAQKVYWRTKEWLAEELGADPTPELQELYEAVLRGDVHAPPSRPAPVVAPAQLPADVFGFAGRISELDQLDSLIAASVRQPTAIVISAVYGTAGVGKTALAVHWARRIADKFPDGQLYVNLRGFDPSGSVMQPADAIRAFLDALGVAPDRIPADLDAQAALYRSLLNNKRVLVVLDNARDAEQIRPLLPGSPGCLLVATSRNSLDGLVIREGAQPLALDLLTAAEAHQLLELRLGPARLAAEPVAVERIVAACARLPLALAIAAARAAIRRNLPLRTLADELDNARLDALASSDRSTDMRMVLSWSYSQLTPAAARLFRLLGLHPGPDISTAAVASLAALPPSNARPLLAELTSAQLLTERLFGRYVLHDLLRAYASELAYTHDAEDDRHAATWRVLDHYLHTADAATWLLYQQQSPIHLAPPAAEVTPERPAGQVQAVEWFSAEFPVLLAAIEHAAGRFDTHVWQLASTLDTFLEWRGRWNDLEVVWSAALAGAARLGDQAARARSSRLLARAYRRLGRIDDALIQLEHALDLYGELGDRPGQARAHYLLGRVWEQKTSYSEALDHDEQALDLYRSAGYRPGQAWALNAVGWDHVQLGNLDVALDYCKQALELCRDLGDRCSEADTWDSLGYAHHHLSSFGEAETCYQHAVDLYQSLGAHYPEADTLGRLGDSQQASGDVHAARKTWRQALAILEELEHPDAEQVKAKLEALYPG